MSFGGKLTNRKVAKLTNFVILPPISETQILIYKILFGGLDCKMGRVYVRKTARQTWSKESMKNAINEVQNNNVSVNATAKKYKLPEPTLRRYLRKYPDKVNWLTVGYKYFNKIYMILRFFHRMPDDISILFLLSSCKTCIIT